VTRSVVLIPLLALLLAIGSGVSQAQTAEAQPEPAPAAAAGEEVLKLPELPDTVAGQYEVGNVPGTAFEPPHDWPDVAALIGPQRAPDLRANYAHVIWAVVAIVLIVAFGAFALANRGDSGNDAH